MKRMFSSLAIGALALTLAACGSTGGTTGTASSTGSAGGGGATDPKDMTMVTVVKISGVGWFDRMETGVKNYAERTGVDARQEGADDASPEKQVKIIQDLIPQKPTAITVVPNSPEALETVLQQARDQGIVVVAHEASGIKNVDADIEAFDNASYGALIMENLGECMEGEGKYVAMVGNLTAKTHMEWVAGADAKREADFKNIERVEEPVESKEDENVAYDKAKALLQKYPDLKGFQGSAGTDVAGIARAVAEVGKSDSVCVMGTAIPSVASKYLKDGSIDKAFFWDPALAGEAQLAVAQLIAEGKTLEEGTDLGIEGYNSLKKLDGFDNVWVGDASVVIDANNVDDYDF